MPSRIVFFIFTLLFFACKNDVVNIKDSNGKLIESYQILQDSTKNGFYKAFYSDGSLKETSLYLNGELDGLRVIYYSNGNPEVKEQYVLGQLEGDYNTYYENGELELTCHYSNGNINGTLTKYYQNGKVEEVVSMVDGNENGPFKEYYENGQIHWEGQYLNGDNEFGLLKEFDENGQLLKKMMCDSLAICRTIWTLADGDITPKY